jgi:hypothetical protein
LAGFLEEREALEFGNQSSNCGHGAHLLELSIDYNSKCFGARGIDAKILFDSFPEGKGDTIFKIAFPLHLRLSKS